MRLLIMLFFITMSWESSYMKNMFGNKQTSSTVAKSNQHCIDERINYKGNIAFIKSCKRSSNDSYRIVECRGVNCKEIMTSNTRPTRRAGDNNSQYNITGLLDESMNLFSAIDRLNERIQRR